MDKKENREKMITGGLGYLGLLFFTAGLLKLIEDKSGKGLLGKFFEYVPAVVCLYLVTMVLGSSGLWENTPEIVAVSSSTSSVLLPALIFLLLLRSDLRKVIKLGPRMIAVFVICSLSIMVSFVLGYLLFRGVLGAADSWKPLSALCGSWIGGTVNMVSIQGALGVSQGDMGYVLMTDTVSYAVWLILMLLVVPWSRRFDRWSGADGSGMEKVLSKLAEEGSAKVGVPTFGNIIFLLGLSAAVSAVSTTLGDITSAGLADFCAVNPVLSSLSSGSMWRVVYASLFGLAAAMTPLGRLGGSLELGNTMLYFVIAVTGAGVNLGELSFAAITAYLLLGLFILAAHSFFMCIAAKLFKFDFYSCQTASLANIGGVASATIISNAYSASLVPIGILMATLGTILGTAGGLVVAKVLELLQ